MPNRKDEEPEEFKVVDRRLFTSEGELRKDLPPEPSQPPTSKTALNTSPQAAATAAEPRAKNLSAPSPNESSAAGQPRGQGAVQFEHLIMSLVTSAMLHLGMAARPGEAPTAPDLPAARETIDLLALLQEKTSGNLTQEETRLLAGALQELRLVFVEVSRQSGRIR
jgi:hypothetical protein